jgi:hypothetical protein
MSFPDFTYPNVEVDLGLSVAEESLFGDIRSLDLSKEFLERLRFSTDLGVALNTEKARSEFIVAPLLVELKLRLGRNFGVFSGVELDVDTSRGLNGVCDFLLTRSPLQTKMSAPVLAIIEAKNDNLRSGLGHCIAATVAAREFNAMEKRPPSPVFGAVTTGTAWQFLRIDGSALTLDVHEYSIAEPGRILAILAQIVS